MPLNPTPAILSSQPFSWQGFAFTVPTEWNLTFHRGGPKRGVVALSALHGKRFEIRWQSGSTKVLRQYYEKLVARAETKQRDAQIIRAPEGLPPEITEITVPKERLYLIATPCRLFECVLPPHVERPMALGVISSMQEFFSNKIWPWQLYGIDGLAPRNYKLVKASLLPGTSYLQFRRYWQNLTLGSFSRADALLAGKSLADFAQHHVALLKHHPTEPVEAADQWVRYQIALRRFGVTARHCLLIEHHPANNVITWRHEW